MVSVCLCRFTQNYHVYDGLLIACEMGLVRLHEVTAPTVYLLAPHMLASECKQHLAAARSDAIFVSTEIKIR